MAAGTTSITRVESQKFAPTTRLTEARHDQIKAQVAADPTEAATTSRRPHTNPIAM